MDTSQKREQEPELNEYTANNRKRAGATTHTTNEQVTKAYTISGSGYKKIPITSVQSHNGYISVKMVLQKQNDSV